ncbi:MAG: cupin domain-containing protein [Caldiserica bacterium]|nr:MAG: cupin domain-containing protein [Caldisericota bacterium]
MGGKPVEMNGEVLEGVTIRWLIAKGEGAKNFFMRYFEMEAGAVIPLHNHSWEHEIYLLKGKCKVIVGEEEKIVDEGVALYIEPDIPHAYENVGTEKVVFLCMIPNIKK